LHHLFCRTVKFPPKMDAINPKWIIIQNIKQSCSMLVITRLMFSRRGWYLSQMDGHPR
jgi:hypothetical protein